jgi:hypothetical protein
MTHWSDVSYSKWDIVCNTPTEFEQSIETLFHVTTGNFKLDMKFVFVLRILDE